MVKEINTNINYIYTREMNNSKIKKKQRHQNT